MMRMIFELSWRGVWSRPANKTTKYCLLSIWLPIKSLR
jgi:hypothetical protein